LESSDICPSVPSINGGIDENETGWDMVSDKATELTQQDPDSNGGVIDIRNVASPNSQSNQLLVWSAAHEAGLTRLAGQYTTCFSDTANENLDMLQSLAYTLASRRSLLSWRSFVVTESVSDLADLNQNISKPMKALGEPSLAFVFTGQGAQWCGMGLDLLVYPTFRQSLLKTQDYLQELGCTWLLLGTLLHRAA
jgi:acyl transferase domain-containing protein